MQSVEMLKKLVSYPTITPKECGIYEYIKDFLSDFKALEFEKEGIKNLFLYKEFGDCKTHLCFGGHIDVVPTGEGWESDPFIPTQKGEYLFGRGVQDMKGGVAAFLCAIREFIDSKGCFNGILSVLLTSDEEGEAIFGTKYVLEELQKLDLLPKYAIVAEPTSVNRFGDMIKIGRRGSINGKLTILGKQGHVAYPSKCINPVELIAPILSKIAGFNMDGGSEEFESSKIVITDIRGGMEVVNVTPNDLKIMFNIRNSPQTSLQDIEDYLENLLRDIPHHLELKQSSKPFLTNSSNFIVKKLLESLQNTLKITPTLSTSGGTSDARYFAEYGVKVVECGVCNDTIHSVNERVKISEIEELKAVFVELLQIFNKE
ncbi:succinyl-diaminopimelate desuccinylase [Helicobacter canadensis]|uniref:Succinyl-diaminopimelate desuccinylase n=1 Tax=Helicobacter canadensis MIT 98-5491 TaxID=537970 RepID=C5ZX84_9HELI|nr:succinyl-diaminopimelate desuccinylase [Helicobacter canadensis]EES89752.1 succinyl-diaminopimelate desuccinylase [Helicobacter canadensis MIT 98-5491]EFR48546.1 succinyl-diaminopimelate desuccinylase [Helicobacter canadensis MIT 98-5491]STO99790.1 succinyl-diaminopimelate desuccinylase [Helicobacter canadensis]